MCIFRFGCNGFNFIFLDNPSRSPELGDLILTPLVTPPSGEFLTMLPQGGTFPTLPLTGGLVFVCDTTGDFPSLDRPTTYKFRKYVHFFLIWRNTYMDYLQVHRHEFSQSQPFIRLKLLLQTQNTTIWFLPLCPLEIWTRELFVASRLIEENTMARERYILY